jgi:DHA2 family multidrug resistance protein
VGVEWPCEVYVYENCGKSAQAILDERPEQTSVKGLAAGDTTAMSDSEELAEGAWRPRVNPWLIAVVVSMAAFMEVLDTSIANVALPHIAGSLGASSSESTWVLTSYLVANAIVLPAAGWMVSALGRKRYFLICLSIFTLSSVFCGMATSLPMLLIARALQGAGGGGLQPMAQAILMDSFPMNKRGPAASLFAVSVFAATAVGPTVGGWITDNYSWRWIFLLKLPLCLLTLLMVYKVVDDPPFLKRLKSFRFDYVGFSLLILGVGALQIFLDKGQEDDWFGSHFIATLVVISAVCLVALPIWEWRQKDPLVDVRLFKSVNFSACCVQMFFIGFIAFSSIVLMPLFLQNLMGYSASLAGEAVSLGALVMFVTMPTVGMLSSKIQARYLLALGWAMIAGSMWFTSRMMDLQMSFGAASWVCVVQRIPIGLIFIPASLAAYFGLSLEKSTVIAGLVNFVRNIGSSVGTSFVTTMLARRAQLHQSRMANNISINDPNFRRSVAALAQHLKIRGLGYPDSLNQAVGRVYAEVLRQAATMSFIDAYWLLFVFSAGMVLSVLFVAKNKPGKEQAVGGV